MSKIGIASKQAGRKKSGVPAVEKALDVLELLADVPQGMTMNELVDAMDRTMGEIYRIVIYLTDRGFLRQDQVSSRYALTLKMFELSHRHEPTENLILTASPFLERFSAQVKQSCHLCVLSGEFVLVLAASRSPLPAGYAVRTGGLFPIEHSSSGQVILAFSPEDVQQRYLASFGTQERQKATNRLARIRDAGYADSPSNMIAGVRDLCSPVFDSRGVVAAVATGYISQVSEAPGIESARTALASAAKQLSKALGFRNAMHCQ
ncbi:MULTISPECIES: IclR family transcriptional regulator [Marinovum]|uniref:IclR family transcriptional regulator n=1 Tax=Marinovum TaxID=367771 RepID=UPI00237B7165|nr:IclR family transcriptional regulator [Marinovum sp. PR37]MDD9746857.1 IclR family transcriptional regulator [Marinovum sp. PR37]